MTAVDQKDPIAATLKRALDQDRLPAHLASAGRQLLARLQQPVRTVIAGAAQGSKSALVNLFLDAEIIKNTQRAPTIEIVFGEEAAVRLEGHDGSLTRRRGLLRDSVLPDRTVRIRQELPLPILVEQSFTIVTLDPGSPARETLRAISDQADVVLWCTDAFGDAERQLWTAVPQHLKDHSFLIWTHSNDKSQSEALDPTPPDLKSIATEEFYGVYPIALRQDRAVVSQDTQRNTCPQIGSDGRQLIDAVSGLVERGRSEDRDQAMALISMLAPDTSIETRGAADQDGQVPHHEAIQSAGQKATEQPTKEDAGHLGFACTKAIEIISAGGKRLSKYMHQDDANADEILSICADTLTNLTGHLSAPEVQDAGVKEAANDVKQGQEMLLQLQLEKTEDAAIDAVAMLHQLKTEFLERSMPP